MEGRSKKTKAQISTLAELLKYLETEPREDFVLKQLNEVKKKIKNRQDAFVPNEDSTLTAIKKAKAKFLKEHGVPQLNKQLREIEILFREPISPNTKN